MAGLMDFLQAASNAAASNVSGPIDLLGWALNKAGIPVGDPVGGSAWMKKKGLMRDIPQSAASLAGETVGLLSPIAAAQYAPQIASGLLKAQEAAKPTIANMAENYMARTGMLQPATVWHGSPHKFDKFDSSKIGTGEGAQAYGHGLYLADAPDVARAYQNALSKYGELRFADGTVENIQDLPYNSARQIAGQIWMSKPNFQDAKFALGNLDPKYLGQPKEAVLKELESLRDANASLSGNLYKVDLPDSAIARMLDWDAPLSQQASQTRFALRNAIGEVSENIKGKELLERLKSRLASVHMRSELERMGIGAHPAGMDGILAEYLSKKEIPGVSYLDGASRNVGQGTRNYVVFPNNEGLLTILERNGKKLSE